MRIAVAQINTFLGKFSYNTEKIIKNIRIAQEKRCDLILFPESTILGYHPFDLLERQDVVKKQQQELKKILKILPSGLSVVLGIITTNEKKKGRPYFNSAALLQKGKTPKFFHKQLLPTGDVFDEARFIENGNMEKNFFTLKGKKVFVTICEDIWAWPDKKGRSIYKKNPIQDLKILGTDLVLNLSASPYHPQKQEKRLELARRTSKKLGAPLVYCNLVGAQDEIIFDGSSFGIDKKGKILLQSAAFEEDFGVLDFDKSSRKARRQDRETIGEIKGALVLGIRDFCYKTGFTKIHLGLSGGIDSAVVTCLAAESIGPQNVTAIAMPSEFNQEQSLTLSKDLARHLGISFQSIPIQALVDVFRQTIDPALQISEFHSVHENLQARIRGIILMAFSNHRNSLLLATGNKCEFAAGYSTLYGDMCGGLAPIGDLLKSQVYALAELYNRDEEIIPREIITRAPSAELRPNQKDQDTLPPYDLLDQSVVRLVEKADKVKSKEDKWLMTALLGSEFKRWQAPPILKVSARSFGRGRRWPIAKKIEI